MFYQVNKSAYQIGIIGTGKSSLPLALVSHKGRREKSESAVDTDKRRLRGTHRKTPAGILEVFAYLPYVENVFQA